MGFIQNNIKKHILPSLREVGASGAGPRARLRRALVSGNWSRIWSKRL